MILPLLSLQGWIYPGNPACAAMQEITDGRRIDMLKPEYLHLTDSGTLTERDASNPQVGCNGCSAANVAAIKKYASQQFVTISGSSSGMVALCNSASLSTTFIRTVLTFLQTYGLTGIELDWEPFTSWTPSQYMAFKAFILTLGTALHTAGFKLMLDGPAIPTLTYQGYYPWKYEDFDSLPVDYLVMMAYDFQYDTGAGTPVASLAAITNCCTWLKKKITDPSRLVIGLNSYGYHGIGYSIAIDTYQQSSAYPGFTGAARDASSGELLWNQATTSYNYSDQVTLTGKVQTVLASGIQNVSIWHLGGNLWPTLPAPVVTVPVVSPGGDPTLAAFGGAYPGFDRWYHTHFDDQGTYTP